MKYRFYICDVFTDRRFGGNQLAVLPDAQGLSTEQMQCIAREFNFSETSFVFPSADERHRQLRIFTPTQEVPFAGHPNIGTAFVLASVGELGNLAAGGRIVFEEAAGLVPVTVEEGEGGIIRAELLAPQPLVLGEEFAPSLIAEVLGLRESDLLTRVHSPQIASVGLPLIFVELVNREALARVRVNMAALAELEELAESSFLHVYTRSRDDYDLRCRMFAPAAGVAEDPATGSANCALGALLSHYSEQPEGDFCWSIAQGVEMGRPSVLQVRAEKRNSKVVEARVGGPSVMVAQGEIEV